MVLFETALALPSASDNVGTEIDALASSSVANVYVAYAFLYVTLVYTTAG